MKQNAQIMDILNEIEGHITTGKNAVNALDTDEEGRIVGRDDCTGAFDNIASSLEDLRGRLHGIADAVGNLISIHTPARGVTPLNTIPAAKYQEEISLMNAHMRKEKP